MPTEIDKRHKIKLKYKVGDVVKIVKGTKADSESGDATGDAVYQVSWFVNGKREKEKSRIFISLISGKVRRTTMIVTEEEVEPFIPGPTTPRQ